LQKGKIKKMAVIRNPSNRPVLKRGGRKNVGGYEVDERAMVGVGTRSGGVFSLEQRPISDHTRKKRGSGSLDINYGGTR